MYGFIANELGGILAALESIDARLELVEDGSSEIHAARTHLLGVMARADALRTDVDDSTRDAPEGYKLPLGPAQRDGEPKSLRERVTHGVPVVPVERRENAELREALRNVDGDDFETFVRAIRADNPNGHGECDD